MSVGAAASSIAQMFGYLNRVAELYYALKKFEKTDETASKKPDYETSNNNVEEQSDLDEHLIGSNSSEMSEEHYRILNRKADELLIAENLSCLTPANKELFHSLSFIVKKYQNVIVRGPSGVGKSSLLRILCGLWHSPTGSITKIDNSEIFFLPQKVSKKTNCIDTPNYITVSSPTALNAI